MKIGILHLSDLHIENDSYQDKVNIIVSTCCYYVREISHLYIVITGDITQHGKENEYDNAKVFISTLQEKIKSEKIILQIKTVIVPGNHDCCFEKVKSTRKTVIKDCLIDVIEEDDYFIDALAVQDNFWNFYKEQQGEIPVDKVSYKMEYIPFINNKIVFHCYNSSWMSDINEEYGGIVIPENKFIKNNNGEITISVFHHPINWLSPNTKNNNRSRFEDHLISTSNIVLFGHEHDKGNVKNIQQKNNNVIFSEGKAFQGNTQNDTGFSYFNLDLSDNSVLCKVYSWHESCYTAELEEKYSLLKKEKQMLSLANDFAIKIDTLKIPLKHSRKENLLLSDVFIFPDVEPIKDNDSIQYINSEELLEDIKKDEKLKVVIEGDDQSGKTTLLFSFYKRLYENGFIPIYIRGKDVKLTDVSSIVKKGIKEQYNSSDVDLVFKQNKRVLLFDNFQSTKLNPKYKATLLQNLDNQFDFIIITTSNSTISNLAVDEINILKGYDKYRLLSLGYEKRGELIEQWLRIGEDIMTTRTEEISKSLQMRLEEVNSLIGNKLMPSYPIFILTILQGLDSQMFQDFTQTSYAHCYHALITAGLVKEGLKDQLNGYFNLLKELSYFLFDEKEDCFSTLTFESFFTKFNKKFFLAHSSSQVLQNLLSANILKLDDKFYFFSYKYIFYYLVAQKIADEIEVYEKLIKKLCENIHLEKNANILIFLSHHSKAQILLDNIIFSSWLPFEDVKPITLNSDDPFSKFMSSFINEIQVEMVKYEDRNPDDEFKKEQKQKDEIARKKNHTNNDGTIEEQSKESIEINQALQTIKILGQIVKNQKGSFEKEKLIELVETAYNSTFRLINFFAQIFSQEKDSIIDAMCDKLEEKNKSNIDFSEYLKKTDREIIKTQIRKFLQFISYNICIGSLNNLMFAVGSRGVDDLYDAVTKKINNPVSKIITFAIKSYYGSINVRELETLLKDVENNHIAKTILLFYVKKHLYTNHIERTKKEKIIQIAGFKQNMLIRRRLD